MDDATLHKWFDNLKITLEIAYLQHTEPWKQSGFSGPEERWIECRKPIANCMIKSGSFLDIGCANGYLLECVMGWNEERGIRTVPYGLDLSPALVNLAKSRIPEFKSNIFIGNGWTWNPPMKFDYVRTELVFVPEQLQKRFVNRLLNKFLENDGQLLVAGYRSRKDISNEMLVDYRLTNWGFDVNLVKSGYWEGQELTRIAVLSKLSNLE